MQQFVVTKLKMDKILLAKAADQSKSNVKFKGSNTEANQCITTLHHISN